MSNGHQIVKPAGSFTLPMNPEDPGFVRTVDGEAWLYYVMPDHPSMFDAVDAAARQEAATPLYQIMMALADLVPWGGIGVRRVMRPLYRRLHVLAVSTPLEFVPSLALDKGSRRRLMQDYRLATVQDRLTFVGVQLVSGGHVRGRSPMGWLLDTLDNVGYVSQYGMEADSAFESDRRRIDRILSSTGCVPPSLSQWTRALAWWQMIRDPEPLPLMIECGHTHTFPSWRSEELAQQYRDTGVPCRVWSERESMRHSSPLTFVSLGVLPFDGRQEEGVDPDAPWGARLMASRQAGGAGAMAVSLRGLVEPGRLTARQLRRDQERMLAAVDRRVKDQTIGETDKVKTESQMDQLGAIYEMNPASAPPTLIDGACVAALPIMPEDDGRDGHVPSFGYPGMVRFNPMRQEAAFQSMQPGSSIEYNPAPVSWPATIVAWAGLAGRSASGEDSGVGLEDDRPGALLGFSEADRQAVYVSPTAASATDSEPIMVVLGGTGSGKTWTIDHLCAQWSRMPNLVTGSGRVPGFIFDPKQKSDFQRFVRAMGGRVVRLDDPSLSDGVLDPVRCMPGSRDFRDEMLNAAVDMLSSITDPNGLHPEWQADLMSILNYGLARGADCTGEAVECAAADHAAKRDLGSRGVPLVPESVAEIRRQLSRLAQSSSMFRIIYGTRHGLPALKASDGLTLLMAGDLNLIPTQGSRTVPAQIQRWIVRMGALGAAAAMMGRGGFVFVDEAWILLGDEAGAAVAQSFGRLGRLQKYLPIFASQRVQEFLDAHLESYVSRGIILSLSGKGESSGVGSEAQAALRLFGLPTVGVMHDRIVARGMVGSSAGGSAPNWNSLRALRNPDGSVLRGAVCYYVDLKGEPTPVEVTIPRSLVDLLPSGSDKAGKSAE